MYLWNRCGRWLATLLALGVVGLLMAQETKPTEGELGKLIDQLGNDDPDVRKEAEKKLFDRGLPALDDLNKAIKGHPDPDVKLRAILLAANIKKGAFGLLRKFEGHSGDGIRSIVVSKDGKRALTGGTDRTIRLWDIETGKELKKLTGHTSWAWEVMFGPDEKQVFSTGSLDRTARRWDLESGKELQQYKGHVYRTYGLAVTPDGKTLFTSGAGSEEGKPNDFTIRQYEVESGKEVQQLEGHTGWVWRLAISPDGSRLASIGFNDYSAKIWDTRTGKLVHDLKDIHEGANVVAVAFSPDSKTLLTGGRDSTARLWDVETGKPLTVYKGLDSAAEALAWSADGKRFLAADGNKVHVFDKASGKIIHRFEEHTDVVYAVAFLPDGNRALSAGKDNVMRMWGVPK